MPSSTAFLRAFGAHVPERVVANAEIAAQIGRTPEWIESVSGIRERRWASPEMGVADLAVAAAEDCLSQAGVPASQLGLLMVASGSAPGGFPGPAAAVAERLGLDSTPAFDLPMASAGSLFGMAIAARLAEAHGDVLVVAAEKMSDVLNAGPLDPNTAMLFGDGAGAVLVSSQPGPWRVVDSILHTDGHFRGSLNFDWKSPLHMDGLSVILQASRKLPTVIAEVLERNGVAARDVAAFLLHQANQNLLARVAKSL